MFKTLLKNLDLKLTILFTLLCIAFVFVPPLNDTPTRTVIGIPLMLFLPGYSLMATLFPRKEDLDGVERIALSFVLSVAIVPLLGLVLNYTSLGIRLTPILFVLSTFTISLSLVAWFRRMNLPTEERFIVPFESLLKFNLGQNVLDRCLSIVLIVSIIGSSATLVYVAVTPKTGERFTEFYILGPNGTISNYPMDLKVGEAGKVIIGILNHEYENVTYELEVKLNEIIIHEEDFFLMHNEKKEMSFIFKVTKIGENQKLEFLIYKGEEIKAYRTLHIWINVTVGSQ